MSEPSAISDPLPDPPKASGGGFLGSLGQSLGGVWDKTKAATAVATAKVVETTNKVTSNPTVQNVSGRVSTAAVATWDVTKKGANKVGEVSKKTWDKGMENEKFAGAVNKVGEVSGKAYEKTKDATVKGYNATKDATQKGYEKTKDSTIAVTGKVVDKTKEVAGKVTVAAQPAVDKTKAAFGVTKKKGREIWEAGGGLITKVQNTANEVGTELGWKGNAKETLLQKQQNLEKWRAVKIRGAEEILIPGRKEFTTHYFVEKGTLVRWTFRVKDLDIGFGVRYRVMHDGGSKEEDILGVEKFDNTETIEGQWTADEDRTIVFVFDNTSSLVRSKNVAYIVGVEPPAGAESAPLDDDATEEITAGVAATEITDKSDFSPPARAATEGEDKAEL